MSVDVFGRSLERSGGSRGPPGVGFKVTSEGHYDMDNKKLCNIANAEHMDEAVNLRVLHRMHTVIFQELNTKITDLINDLKDLADRTTTVEETVKNYGPKIESIIEIITRLSVKLDPIDLRVSTSEKNDTS